MTAEPTHVDVEATTVVPRVTAGGGTWTEAPAPPELAAALSSASGAPPPSAMPADTSASAASQVVTCPECGTVAQVTLNRRESRDFCRNCDYPLFWTPNKVFYDRSDGSEESLRRLPGTVGRATVASLACPHCSEPNALTAQTCVRCGRPMHLVEAPPPPPAPVVAPPPPPAPAPPPDKGVSWWVWLVLGIGAAALITLVILILTHVIN